MGILDTKTYYAVLSCTLEDYNNETKIADPLRNGYYANPKLGVVIDVFSHNGEVTVALGFGMKSSFSK